MNTITITAQANGSSQPPTTNFPNTLQNGDFTINGKLSSPVVGNGVDESTKWNFDFSNDPNFLFFSSSNALVSAKLTLFLTVKGYVQTDNVRIDGFPGVAGPIPSLPPNTISVVTINLLNVNSSYSSSGILGALYSGTLGVVPMIYQDDAIISHAKLELTQRLPVYQYAIKIVCGKADGKILAKGIYHTAINIHNPSYKMVTFRKKFAVALPGKPGDVTRFFDARLGSDQALEIDCPEIMKYTKCKNFVKGFVIIESDFPLDIVAVYTAASSYGKSEEVQSIHSERVKPRKRRFRKPSTIDKGLSSKSHKDKT